MIRRVSFGCLVFVLAQICQAEASGPIFRLPLDCRIGIDCWVANYVDWNVTNLAEDYTCGELSYDDHRGTDFAVRDMRAVRRGISVLVAADGRVLRTRDGEPESTSTESRARARETGRECGNGVVIDHGDGWTSQYCHMRKGSIKVQAGQVMKAGEAIGQVGVSGVTEFPHLHFKVEHADELVDPFMGSSPTGTCGQSMERSLWSAETREHLTYRRGQIFNVGFAEGPPELRDVRLGRLHKDRMSCDSSSLVAWMEAFGVRQGDRFRMRLLDPEGQSLVSKEEVLERTQARIFRFGGKRLRSACWQTGEYQVEFTLFDGEDEARILSRKSVRLLVVPAEQESR